MGPPPLKQSASTDSARKKTKKKILVQRPASLPGREQLSRYASSEMGVEEDALGGGISSKTSSVKSKPFFVPANNFVFLFQFISICSDSVT